MQAYKRNQVEGALSLVVDGGSSKPSPALRTRIKRLLETDRGLPQQGEAGDPHSASSAFFSVESPGKGGEIWFSAYETFALLTGLFLMHHGWPQSFAVKVLRRVRPELENAFSATMAQDPKWLFDQDEIRRNARAGDFAFDNQDPYLLTIVSSTPSIARDEDEPYACGVQRGQQEAFKFARQHGGNNGAFTMYDLVENAHRVSAALAKTKPESRGRATRKG